MMILLNKSTGNSEQLGVIRSFRLGLLLQNGPQNCRNRYVNPGSQRSAIVVYQHDIVAVEFGNLGKLILPASDQDGLLLLALDRYQHLIANLTHHLFVVNVDALGRFTLGHGPLADVTVVYHAKPGQLADLHAGGARLDLVFDYVILHRYSTDLRDIF